MPACRLGEPGQAFALCLRWDGRKRPLRQESGSSAVIPPAVDCWGRLRFGSCFRKVMTSCMRELQKPLPPKCGKELWRAETSKPQRCLLPQWLLLEAGIMTETAMKARHSFWLCTPPPDSARSGESCMAQTLQVMPDAHT